MSTPAPRSPRYYCLLAEFKIKFKAGDPPLPVRERVGVRVGTFERARVSELAELRSRTGEGLDLLSIRIGKNPEHNR